MAVAISFSGLDQFCDLNFGEMLAWPQLAIRPPAWRNCPFFFCRGDQFETRLSHRFSPPIESTVCNLAEEWTDASSKTETQLACVTFRASWVSNLKVARR